MHRIVPWAKVVSVDKLVIYRECNLQGLIDWMENGLGGFWLEFLADGVGENGGETYLRL